MRSIRIPFRIPFFRIFYSTTYTILLLTLFVLLAITPADHITQTLENNNLGNVFAVGAVYAVTAVIAIFIFASRLYTTRVTLASIPRFYLPIDDGEVTTAVRRAIVMNLQRSALIAWDTRPRDVRPEMGDDEHEPLPQDPSGGHHQHHHHHHLHHLHQHTGDDDGTIVVPIDPHNPPWGPVAHPGWTSPASPDLPSLHFNTVLAELPNLIEAKAVSLAPPDSSLAFIEGYNDQCPAPPDPDMVLLLQRPPTVGLREYLNHLNSLGVIDSALSTSATVVATFLARYEAARFAARPMSELAFRDLMAAFAALLTIMTAVISTDHLQDGSHAGAGAMTGPAAHGVGSGRATSRAVAASSSSSPVVQESVVRAGDYSTRSSTPSPPASVYSSGSVVHHIQAAG